MLTFLTRALMLFAACAAAAGCGGDADEAPPVATPSVTLSRTSAAIGTPLDVTYRFVVAAGAPAFQQDYTVFVHFVDADGELMWTDDHQPPTPTRQWKGGARIEYSRTVFVPKFPYAGEARVNVGLYDPASGDRLPLAATPAGQRAYQVATFEMREQADNVFVVFRDGWHDTEVEPTGLEWQWSRKEGIVSFRNPKRDALLLVQLDQPAFRGGQQVMLRVGSTVVDTFPLAQGESALRRLNLTAAQLGDAETVEMGIAVDKTFVPATVPELKSSDARELGVRVFRVYVEPK